jgi:sarcosine reductase
MRLEMATFTTKNVRFGERTGFESGVLEVNKDELIKLVLEDKRVVFAGLEIVYPGEKVRVVKVRDAVEPRVKVSGPGCVFPGILGPVETVGEGRTHRLSGVTVMLSAEYEPTVLSGTGAQSSGIVDMWGPAAPLTPFSSLTNIVLMIELACGVSEMEAHAAMQLAEFKVGRRLAETTVGKALDELETFELVMPDPALPKIIYIAAASLTWHNPHSGLAYYGLPIRESLPTFMHPNEFLDGAITKDMRIGNGSRPSTWSWMSPAVVLELLRQHGKTLNFLGVILQRTRFETEFGKEVTAACASQMVRLLGAEGVISTRISTSGNNFMDMMFTVQACERKGVKTVFVTPEWGGKHGDEMPLVYYVPEATAMISTGSFERDVPMLKPDRVFGVGNCESVQLYAGDKFYDPAGEFTLPASFCFLDGVDCLGSMHLTCEQY